ncbi:MAG TPA: methyltransferase domain-containing protein [Stellaceae bacterium]|nr:methyltransferase domain-containing protein [Stellaceae bacterium]
MPSSRADYDAIADSYDSQPYRGKSADPELAAFLTEHRSGRPLALLDIACGTGSQLIANRPLAAQARMVGVDGSLGMLQQARRKAADIDWLQSDAAALPLGGGSFDFGSCQYAFHHFQNKAGMLREAFRVLGVEGRLVIYNLCPHEMPEWIYYAYFPEARDRDLIDFWSPERLTGEMQAIGFRNLDAKRQHIRFDHDLVAFLETTRRRENNSQLMALTDAAYEAGLRRIERDLAAAGERRVRADHLCFLTVRGDKPVDAAHKKGRTRCDTAC